MASGCMAEIPLWTKGGVTAVHKSVMFFLPSSKKSLRKVSRDDPLVCSVKVEP